MSDRDSRVDEGSPLPEDVLVFWLGLPDAAPLANATKWYTKDPAFDREIAERFGATLEAAARGGLDGWKETRRGRLALVIVLDQFSRNVYRNTPRAFAQDTRACSIALEAISLGDEETLATLERAFLYMPLMHAEDADLQHKAVAAFDRLRTSAPAELKSYVESALEYARKHAEIIERFGRFPHRNAILGRASTPRELEFLEQPGSSF
jgi:uncharacterized protein (DUF924 family)